MATSSVQSIRSSESLLSSNDSNKGYRSIMEHAAVENKGEYAEKTPFGKMRSMKNFKWMEWSFILIGIVILLSVGGTSIERFVYFSTHNYSNDSNVSFHSCDSNFDDCLSTCDKRICMTDFTFVILVLVNVVICCFYAVDSLLREQKFEMLAVCIATIVISLYIIVNFITNGPEEEQGPVRILRLVLCFVLGIPFFVLAIMLYFKMGKLKFTLTDSKKMRSAYQLQSLLCSILFFNIHAIFNLVLLATVRNGTFLHDFEKAIITIFSFYSIAIIIVGLYGIHYDDYSATIIFLILYFPLSLYYIYKIINVSMNLQYYKDNVGIDGTSYISIAVLLYVVNVILLIMFVLVYIFTIFVMRNFQQDLKSTINPPFYTCYKRLHDKFKPHNQITV